MKFYFNESKLNSLFVGYVDMVKDNIIRIRAVSPEGLNDGYILRRLSDIIKIERNTLYLKKIKKIAENLHYLEKNIEINNTKEKDLLTDTLKIAKKKKLLITLYFDEDKSSLTGYVKELGDEEIKISVIDEYGMEDGEHTVTINIIDQIDINSLDNRKIELLL
ncbi:hypothetical protein [Sebaldella sp. S0638]|uniref:hypothetical protein n=1 Tax=Sebaldella sp. S0638 TaxID=2957809 RepID=UPI0020A107E8|nr:hypothetical protein [Sebaldella sp. S0638]MCP1224315.1 hypothetical protein [Sebaldella sp. S0638]